MYGVNVSTVYGLSDLVLYDLQPGAGHQRGAGTVHSLAVVPVIVCSPLQKFVVCLVSPVLICSNWQAQLPHCYMLAHYEQETTPACLAASGLPLQPHVSYSRSGVPPAS